VSGTRHRIVLIGLGLLIATAGCGANPTTPTLSAPSTAPTIPPPALAITSAAATPASSSIPTPDHVVIAIFENKDVDQVLGNGQAPFLDQLAQSGVDFTNFHAETHPSQPNYLAFFSGDTLGITDDSCLPPLTAPNLGNQLLAAGRSFVGYSEDLPRAGFTGCRSGNYAQKHAPWTAFTTLPAATNQPWTAWPASFEQLPTVAFVIPNLCHDMHDCDVSAGDQWLGQNLGTYLTWARSHNSLLIVTFDETASHEGSNRIVTLMDGAGLKTGPVDEPIDHYRLLRTIEAMYHLPALGRAAATQPISDIWAPQAH
jgi:acid phosphatase